MARFHTGKLWDAIFYPPEKKKSTSRIGIINDASILNAFQINAEVAIRQVASNTTPLMKQAQLQLHAPRPAHDVRWD